MSSWARSYLTSTDSDIASDSNWKDKLKAPIKDTRPQTEVHHAMIVLRSDLT